MHRSSILLFGSDTNVLHSRQLVLQNCGYEARFTSRIDEAEQLLRAGSIDLLVLCHTASSEDCDYFLDTVAGLERHVKVLVLLSGPRGCSYVDRHAVIDVMDGPGRFVATVNELVA